MITIFTPTYNRASLLGDLYDSLKKQTSKNFEWIIVDDASTDNTKDIIDGFMAEDNEFEIISLKQSHGGKHRAINLGVGVARYDWFFIVDSDDTITEDAVAWIEEKTLTVQDRDDICGISGTRVLKNGERIDGDLLISKDSYIDLYSYESYKINAAGDMAEVWKTKLLKKYPFPDYKGEYRCGEGVVWNRMAEDGYKIRYFNKAIYVFEYLEDGLTKTASLDNMCENFRYLCDSYYLLMKHSPQKVRVANLWNYVRVAHRKNIKFKDMPEKIGLKKGEFYKMCFLEIPIYVAYRCVCKVMGK
jgi:glycosyltransferase involved in cell wall biosynthesis